MTRRTAAILVLLLTCWVAGCVNPAAQSIPAFDRNVTPGESLAKTPTPTPTPTPLQYRDRGIPYYDGSGTVPAVLYDPTGDEAEVRFAIQIDKKRDAVVLDPVVYKDPDARLICRVHPGDGAIVHVTAVRHGSINYYAVPI